MNKKKIDLRQMKYWLPALAYLPLLLLGYLVIDTFNLEVRDKTDHSLVLKNELNADLPSAQVGEDLGDKLANMRRQYGNIREESAIANVESDKDSIGVKLGYSSSLSEEELAAIREKQRADSLENLLRERERLDRHRGSRDQSGEEFTRNISKEDRQRMDRLKKRGLNVEELERDLGISLDSAAFGTFLKTLDNGEEVAVQDSVKTKAKAKVSRNKVVKKKVVEEIDEEAESNAIVKKVTETNRNFNTISANVNESNMIKAIIDEEIKVVDGSRVRLRLLDDVEVDHVLLKKGSYLYATMSGFSKQRIKGKISSLMVGDDLMKCNLNLYDMDGLEGLYIPESSFRETAKDVGSGVFSGGSMNVSGSLSAESTVAQFASQALQNAYQKTSQAIAKAIKKNKVRLKYGTQVYLINGNKKKEQKASQMPSQGVQNTTVPGGRMTFPPMRQ